MASFGNSAYSINMSAEDTTGDKKSKSISGINFNATGAGGGSSALGADVDMLYEFMDSLQSGIMQGSGSPTYKFTDSKTVLAD